MPNTTELLREINAKIEQQSSKIDEARNLAAVLYAVDFSDDLKITDTTGRVLLDDSALKHYIGNLADVISNIGEEFELLNMRINKLIDSPEHNETSQHIDVLQTESESTEQTISPNPDAEQPESTQHEDALLTVCERSNIAIRVNPDSDYYDLHEAIASRLDGIIEGMVALQMNSDESKPGGSYFWMVQRQAEEVVMLVRRMLDIHTAMEKKTREVA